MWCARCGNHIARMPNSAVKRRKNLQGAARSPRVQSVPLLCKPVRFVCRQGIPHGIDWRRICEMCWWVSLRRGGESFSARAVGCRVNGCICMSDVFCVVRCVRAAFQSILSIDVCCFARVYSLHHWQLCVCAPVPVCIFVFVQAKVLFEETSYNKKSQPYRVLCIDRVLTEPPVCSLFSHWCKTSIWMFYTCDNAKAHFGNMCPIEFRIWPIEKCIKRIKLLTMTRHSLKGLTHMPQSNT